MTGFARQVGAIVRKDLKIELREPTHVLTVVLFGFLLLLLFSFGLSVEPELMRRFAPGLFWLATLFASLLTLEHSLQRETEEGQWDGLLLMGIDAKALFLGKVLFNLILVFLLQIVLLPLMAVLFDLSLTPSLFLVLFLGSLGIATLGTSYSGLTASLRGGQALLPLLLFPMLVPLLLAAVEVTRLTVAHDLFDQQVVWLKLLILFDTVFLLGSLLTADGLFDKS